MNVTVIEASKYSPLDRIVSIAGSDAFFYTLSNVMACNTAFSPVAGGAVNGSRVSTE